MVRPSDVGGRAAWQVLVRGGALRAVVDDAAVPVGVAVTAEVRGAALAPRVPAGAVVTGPSAVWVHCGGALPEPLDLVRRTGTLRLASDCTWLGGVRVTAVGRTVVDVATRLPHEQALGLVLELARGGADLAAAARFLERRNRVVGRPAARAVLAAARERLAAAAAGP